MDYETKLLECYKTYFDDELKTIEDVKKYLDKEWGKYGHLGFAIFTSDETDALHVQRIDEMDIFDGDLEAADYAERNCGIKLIPLNQIKDIYPYHYMRFIDTEENRKILKEEGALMRIELIGQIIDIFEDELTERSLGNHCSQDTWEAIPLHYEDKDCNGVFYGGYYYDKVAKKIEETLKEWRLIKNNKIQSELYVVETTVYGKPAYCVSTSPDEAYCDEEIWLHLGISEEKFYALSRRHNPNYFFHTFDYGTDKKEVCDTNFIIKSDALEFMKDLLNV